MSAAFHKYCDSYKGLRKYFHSYNVHNGTNLVSQTHSNLGIGHLWPTVTASGPLLKTAPPVKASGAEIGTSQLLKHL